MYGRFLLFWCLISTAVAKVSYEGYIVGRFTPHTDQQLEYLNSLEEYGVQFWRECSYIGRHCDLMLSPALQLKFLDSISSMGIEIESFIDDLGSLVEESISQQGNGRIDWDSYYGVEDIYAFLQEQADLTNSTTVSVINIGKSAEERDINVLRIAKNATRKPVIFVEANIHAREWITSAVATFLINELLYSEDPEIQGWTDDFDFYILPVFNVDGLEYTRNSDRMWRKSRGNTSNSCIGTDLNRSFDYNWCGAGSSTSPCSDTFCGSGANLEPETAVLTTFLKTLQNDVAFYLAVHSYSQFIMFSFGDKIDETFYDSNMLIATQAAEALAERYGTKFIAGNWLDILYVSTGTSMDWAKTNMNDTLALTFELRDEGRYGFLLPADQIRPSGEEFVDSLKPIIKSLRAKANNSS